jgi:hypothetical protein
MALGEKMTKRKKKLMSMEENGSAKKAMVSDKKTKAKKPPKSGRGKSNGVRRDSVYTG